MSEPAIPSQSMELISELENHVLTDMMRIIYSSVSQSLEMGLIKNEKELFALGYGSILLRVDSGKIIGIADEDTLRSVLLWLEEDNTDVFDQSSSNAEEGFPVKCTDPRYSTNDWSQFVDQKISKVFIIKHETKSFDSRLKNEVGIQLVMENGSEFIAAIELSEKVGHLVLLHKHEIRKDTVNELDFIEV